MALYDKRPRRAEDVAARLRFHPNGDDLDERTLKVFQMFRYRLLRWLYGSGHPENVEGTLVDTSKFDQQKQDPLLRAKLLLLAMTDSDLLPVAKSDTLDVRCRDFIYDIVLTTLSDLFMAQALYTKVLCLHDDIRHCNRHTYTSYASRALPP